MNENEYSEGKYILQNRKADHLKMIKKVTPNDSINAGRINLDEGVFHILEVNNSITGIYESHKNSIKKYQGLEVWIAFQRPQTMKKILFLTGMLGIPSLKIIRTNKSEKSYESSSIWRDDSWKEEIYLGMEQGKNIFFPEISFGKSPKNFLNLEKEKETWFLHPGGEKMSVLPEFQKLRILIGPEAGFSSEEILDLSLMGAKKIGLSDVPFRTEHAFMGLFSQIEILR